MYSFSTFEKTLVLSGFRIYLLFLLLEITIWRESPTSHKGLKPYLSAIHVGITRVGIHLNLHLYVYWNIQFVYICLPGPSAYQTLPASPCIVIPTHLARRDGVGRGSGTKTCRRVWGSKTAAPECRRRWVPADCRRKGAPPGPQGTGLYPQHSCRCGRRRGEAIRHGKIRGVKPEGGKEE